MVLWNSTLDIWHSYTKEEIKKIKKKKCTII